MAIDPTTTTTVKVSELASAGYNTTDLIPHEVAGILKKGNLQDLATFIGGIISTEGAVGFRAVQVNDGETLPATDEQEFILVGPGTYPNVGGGPTITTTEPLNALVSNATYWFIGVEIPITATGVWGTITGVLSDQTDLNDVLDAKADLVDGKVPNSQLPSYVDDVVEVANYAALPATGETGKIYVTIDNGNVYRWSGSAYIRIADESPVWGIITGTLSDQTDLQNALDGKFDVPTGDTTQYIAGDGSLITFPVAGQAGTLVRLVRNNSGATITKGTVVYINGASGNNPTIAKAIATGDSTSAQTFGLLQADITNNSNGYVVVTGDLIGVNTSAIAEGSQLYLSSTTAGAYTTTKQLAPAHLVYIGVVTRSHATLGQIEVKIQNGYELDELHDVAISSKANNEVIVYESSTDLWKNKSIATILGYTPANDASVVKLTGDQTISGVKTFSNPTTFNSSLNIASGAYSILYNPANSAYWQTYVDSSNVFNFGYNGNIVKASISNSGNFTANSFIKSGGTSSQFLKADGSVDSTTYQTALTNPVTGTGTTNYIPKFTGASAIGNSNITDNGTVVAISTDATINGVPVGKGLASLANNIRIGGATLLNVTTGDSNIAIGSNALQLSTTGASNVAIGRVSMINNTTGFYNVAVGRSSLGANTTGYQNTAIGGLSLGSNTTGVNNVSLGYNSLTNLSSGNTNVSLGESAGRYITNGTTSLTISSNSIFLGSNTKALADNQTNQIVIGHNATGLGSNTTVLGNSSTTTTAIYGSVGIGTISPSQKLTIGDGTATGNQYLRINSSATDIYIGQSGSGLFGLAANSGGNIASDNTSFPLAIGTIGSQSLIFGTTNAERMRLTTNGELLIGRTSSYGAGWQLAVEGNIYAKNDLRVDDNASFGGNVGIGTTSPSQLLHIEKDQNTYTNLRVRNNDAGSSAYTMIGLNSSGNSWGMRMGSSAANSNRLDFVIDAFGSPVERMSITSGGNVGIGTTSPAEKLSVSGAIISTGGITGHGANRTSLSQEGSNGAYWQSYGADASTVGTFNLRQATSDFSTNRIALHINSVGNIGIGTTSPDQKLTVEGNIRVGGVGNGFLLDTLGVNYTNGMKVVNNYETVMFSGRGSSGYVIAGDNNLRFGFGTNYSAGESMRITSGGRVGIGFTSPVAKLSVRGEDNTSSNYSFEAANGSGASLFYVRNDGATFVVGTITSSGGFFNSDIRLKDLTDYDYNVSDIKPITYLWKDGRDNKKHVGYSAQEVQKVMPDAVNEGTDGMLSVNYVEVLVAKIAELENRIKQLEK